jgi:hypothetical protein
MRKTAVAAASTWALNAWRGSAAARAALRKPSLGSGLKIFIQPAVIVTARSQAEREERHPHVPRPPHLDQHRRAERERDHGQELVGHPEDRPERIDPAQGSTTPW